MEQRTTVCGHLVLIGIPTLGRPVPLHWAMAWKSLAPPINSNMNVMTVFGKEVAVAREEICEQAVKMGHKYVFFLGDDVEVPHHTLKQMIFRMEQNPEIGVIGGVYVSKSDPPAPLVFRGNGIGSYWDWKIGEFFEVTGLGMDCTIIRTDILKQMKKPWFKTVDNDQFADGVNHADQWTEDLYFLKKVNEETSAKIFCDASIICKHWDVYANKAYTLPVNSLPSRRMVAKKEKTAVDIGCGPIDRSDEFPDYNLVRLDIDERWNPDYRCDVRNIPLGTESVDLVFSSHVLEHIPRQEFKSTLEEWIRILRKGGDLKLVLPNIEWAIQNFGKKDVNQTDVLNVLYGAQSSPYDFHYNAMSAGLLTNTLKEFNFTDIRISYHGYNLIVEAKKNGN